MGLRREGREGNVLGAGIRKGAVWDGMGSALLWGMVCVRSMRSICSSEAKLD